MNAKKIIEENKDSIISLRTDFRNISRDQIEDSESISEGEGVIFIGYPSATELLGLGFGLTMTTSECIISSVKRRGGDKSLHFFLVDTRTNKGSSGSPVFSLETGKVIGVVSGKISSKFQLQDGKIIDIPANIGICRPSKYISGLENS